VPCYGWACLSVSWRSWPASVLTKETRRKKKARNGSSLSDLCHLCGVDEPTNHQVHSTTYVEDSDKILVAKSKKKIFVGTNLCNNENKTDILSCILIGSILLKFKEPRDHVWVPQGFTKGRDTFLSSSTRPQVLPITKSHGMESSSPVRVQLRIQEQSTLKLMSSSHTTSN
jgi:hypothetical protein